MLQQLRVQFAAATPLLIVVVLLSCCGQLHGHVDYQPQQVHLAFGGMCSLERLINWSFELCWLVTSVI